MTQDPQGRVWQTEDRETYVARADMEKVELLPPNLYKCHTFRGEAFFTKIEDQSDEILRFKNCDSVITDAVAEVKQFWNKREFFLKHGFAFRRGILFHGPPGSGKSCALKMIVEDIVKSGGIAVKLDNVHHFSSCMEVFRKVQPDTPVIAIIEDIDEFMYDWESEFLNILDGFGGFDGIVYLATTNYLDKLPSRIKNRPSRFDRRFLIDYPGPMAREEYLEYIISKSGIKIANHIGDDGIYIPTWVSKTEKFSFAHLKELFVSVVAFDTPLDEAVSRLKEMGAEALNDENEDEDDDEACSAPVDG